jgi:glycosyltransferase involved in cell wall biosynthesis
MSGPLKVLYFCEGFTDIRFVIGLSEMCDLTMATPAWEFRSSGLGDRIDRSGARVRVHEIQGRRPAFQIRSFLYLLRHIKKYDVVLSQEMVRGSLNATIAGRVMGVPVVTYLAVSPVEYFRCRRERGQIGWLKARVGEVFIRCCMAMTGRLGTAAIGLGPYLRDVAGSRSSHPLSGLYYGVDVNLFRPVDAGQRQVLRRRHDLPENRFLIFFASRMSHEKDPETVLRAIALVRKQRLDAVVLNLGGGFQEFLKVARRLALPNVEDWVIGRPAVHPMEDLCEYFQTADVVVQASLAEGGGISPLEALACGTPVVATNVGGMAQLAGIAQLTPRRDEKAMADAILWIAEHRSDAAAQAMRGRDYVVTNWRREKAFGDLKTALEEAVRRHRTGRLRRSTSSGRPQRVEGGDA